MNMSDRITNRSTGQFDPQNWMTEGDGLIASSSKLRQMWIEHRKNFPDALKTSDGRSVRDEWALLRGLPRSSMLLLGYAVEMYLKAGLAKAYRGCATEMFDRDLKRCFGHDQAKLAIEIAFLCEPDDETHFQTLQNMVLVDARYPVNVTEGQNYADAVNQQTNRIWSAEHYEALHDLAMRVRTHVSAIDQDRSNPCHYGSYAIDADGYFSFRIGGRLPPRITYRLSTVMRDAGAVTPTDVRGLFDPARYRHILHYWDQAVIYEDGQTENGRPKTYIQHLTAAS